MTRKTSIYWDKRKNGGRFVVISTMVVVEDRKCINPWTVGDKSKQLHRIV